MATPLIKIIPDFSTTLASKVAVAATTASLSTATDSNGDVLATGKYGFTIDRKNSSKEYFTATLTGTSLTNIATIDITDGTETSGLAKAHRKGAEIIISDFVALKRIQDVLESGYVDTYVPTTDFQIATKAYADGLTIGGAPNGDATTKGIYESATTAEIDSGASVGSTGASLVVTSDSLNTSKYQLGLLTATQKSDLITAMSAVPVVRVYTSNGTWTKPANLKYIEVEVQAGGAGAPGSYTQGVTSGAGAGGYSKKTISVSSLGATETYTVGAGGIGGLGDYSGTAPTNGGNSTFGSIITCYGGNSNRSGGSASGGDINISGQNGRNAAGGFTNSAPVWGNGGNSMLGFGGAGNGDNGVGYGAGGAGVAGGNAHGGNGSQGIIIVTEFY